jgi:hypothetical protein
MRAVRPASRESLVTDVARIRLLSRVYTLVHGERGILGKARAARGTFVRFVTSVRAHVLLEVLALSELPPTLAACVLITPVLTGFNMLLQLVVPQEHVSAITTQVMLLVCLHRRIYLD